MDIAMVAVGSCLREGKAKGASRSQRPRIERAFDSGDRMGDCIIVRPDHLRTRLHREGRWTESKVRDRDAVASAGRAVVGVLVGAVVGALVGTAVGAVVGAVVGVLAEVVVVVPTKCATRLLKSLSVTTWVETVTSSALPA